MANLRYLRDALVSVPHRSGADKSFRNLFTAKCGTLVPILCDEVLPNTKIHLNLALSAQLPPLASETFMNVDYNIEAFFVPTRLLMSCYEDWLTGNDAIKSPGSSVPADYLRVPVMQLTSETTAAGTLADYLGFMTLPDVASMSGTADVCAFPFLAYHLIYNEWYRNPMIQKDIFYNEAECRLLGPDYHDNFNPFNSRWFAPREDSNNYIFTKNSGYADGVRIVDLRQRNFGVDYFTVATPSPQSGDAQKVSMVVPGITQIPYNYIRQPNAAVVGSDTVVRASEGGSSAVPGSIGVNTNSPLSKGQEVSFTIASLRAANSMQLFLERNNICGPRLVDYVKGQYGATLKDSIAQRPVYLGSISIPVYSKGIYQSAQSTGSPTNNPFDSVGARYGHAYVEGNGHLIDFSAEEPGYIMVLGSLTPRVTYSSGVERYLMRYTRRGSQSDMANPLLQNVGNQPIYNYELSAETMFGGNPFADVVFGYVERYADWKTRNHQLHGLLRDGKSLQSFALQRSFPIPYESGEPISISSEFLQIPTDYLDQVTAVDGAVSGYGIWIDSWLDYKVSHPLYEYCIPSLQDPAYEHGNTFTMRRGGTRID